MEAKKLLWLAVIVLCIIGLVYVSLTHEAAGAVWYQIFRFALFFGMIYGVKWVWDKFTKKN